MVGKKDGLSKFGALIISNILQEILQRIQKTFLY